MSYKGFDLIKSAQKMGLRTLKEECGPSSNGKHRFVPTANGNDLKCVFCNSKRSY